MELSWVNRYNSPKLARERIMLDFIAKPPRKKKGKKLVERICARLDGEGIPYAFHYTKEKGDGAKIARELTQEEGKTLVVVGGDGSLNDVLTGIVDPEKCTLGLIPAGTGNDFAAAANIPHGEKALDLILKGSPKKIDYIDFSDGRRSINIAGLGLDVDILTRCENMKIRGKSNYIFGLLSSLVHFRGCEVLVEADGIERKMNAMIVAVCNGKQCGGGIPLCPPAVFDDGKMDLLYVDYPKRSKILGALIKLMRGKILSLPFAHYATVDYAKITPSSPRVAQYDGELYETACLEATLKKGGLNLYL